MRNLLTPAQISDALATLDHWTLCADDKSIEAKFEFDTFADAFAFMGRIARIAEELDHHPNWSNSYRRVAIRLTTHSAGGVSELDTAMARRIEFVL